jgi:glycosyltransferase involved in cell wall biosynthesis
MSNKLFKYVPKVSVLMTVFNAEPYLKEAIDSVIKQNFYDWELIAVENGSTDRSPEILRHYKDERVRQFFLPKNIGRTLALNYALEQAQGEYIAVLDADDVSNPDRFTKQVAYLDQHPETSVVGAWAMHINARGEEVGRFTPPINEHDLYDMVGWMNPFVHSSIMYRGEEAKKLGF